MKKLESGWNDDSYGALPYHFSHFPKAEADKLEQQKSGMFIVETINWTLADERTVHRNEYFAVDFSMALSLAVEIEIGSRDVAEEVVGIRPATPSEIAAFEHAMDADEFPIPDSPALHSALPNLHQ